MKYGRSLLRAADASPDAWSNKWLDYKQLKKLLKRVVELYRLKGQAHNMVATSDADQGLKVVQTREDTAATSKGTETGFLTLPVRKIPLLPMHSNPLEKQFFEKLKFELRKVTDFYISKLANLTQRANPVSGVGGRAD